MATLLYRSNNNLITLAWVGIGFLGLGYQNNNVMQMLLAQNNTTKEIKMEMKNFMDKNIQEQIEVNKKLSISIEALDKTV